MTTGGLSGHVRTSRPPCCRLAREGELPRRKVGCDRRRRRQAVGRRPERGGVGGAGAEREADGTWRVWLILTGSELEPHPVSVRKPRVLRSECAHGPTFYATVRLRQVMARDAALREANGEVEQAALRAADCYYSFPESRMKDRLMHGRARSVTLTGTGSSR